MEQASRADERHHHHRPRHKRLIRRLRRRLGPGRFRQIVVLAVMLLVLALVCYLFMQKVTQPPPMPVPE